MKTSTRRTVLASLVAAVLAVPLGVQAQSKPTPVSIRLDWKPGAQHAPFYVAKEKGYFTEEGLDVTIISGSGSSDSLKQVGARAVQFGLIDALVLVQGAEQRVPARAVAVYYQRTPIVLMSPKAKPVTSVQQLTTGIKVGSKKGSSTFQGLTALLGANNIKPEQVSLVDIGFGVQPLLVKQVDAMMGFTMNEPIEAESAGMPIHELAIADAGVNTYGLVIATNDDVISKQPDTVTKFLRATKRAVADIAANKAAAVQTVVKAAPEAEAPREAKVLDRTIPFWSMKGGDIKTFGTQSLEGWQQTVATAKRLGLVETAPDAKNLFNGGLMK